MKFQIVFEFDATTETKAKKVYEWLTTEAKNLGSYVSGHTVGPLVPLDDPEIAKTSVIVHTDGGCDLKKAGVGAWAAHIGFVDGREPVNLSGVEIGTTNNRMEMMAVIQALQFLEIGTPITIVADSEYVIKGCTQWVKNWKRRGWVTADNKPVKNQDLWEMLSDLCDLHNLSWQHVAGHSGHALNDHVDETCTALMEQKLKELGLK